MSLSLITLWFFIKPRHNKHHLQLSPMQKDDFLLSGIPVRQTQEPWDFISGGSRNTCIFLASSGDKNALTVLMLRISSAVPHWSGNCKEGEIKRVADWFLFPLLRIFITNFNFTKLTLSPHFCYLYESKPPEDLDRKLQMGIGFPHNMLIFFSHVKGKKKLIITNKRVGFFKFPFEITVIQLASRR